MNTETPHTRFADFRSFFEFLRDDSFSIAAISPERFMIALDMNARTLARLSHVRPHVLKRNPTTYKVQDFMRDSLRVLKAAYDIEKDLEQAITWYRQESLAAFDHQTAESVVSTGRAQLVIRRITSESRYR